MTIDEFKTKYDIRLNDQQMQAVQRVDGATLLLAVPGSGKTTVIVARTGYMLHVAGIDPRHILTLTYTRAAAREMRERFIKKFGGDPGFICPHFSTINSFCVSVLKIVAQEGRAYIPTLEPNPERIIRKIAVSMMPEYPSDATIRNLSQLVTQTKNLMRTEEDIKSVPCTCLNFPKFFRRYQQELKANSLMDFDDQMIFANMYLDEYPDLLERAREQYQYISLDEAQDTSLIQHKLVEKLVGPRGNIFMVGDEDQSIYGFRGAYPKALLSFEETYPNAKVMLMETNYRSDQKIVNASGEFIQRNEDRHEKTLRANSDKPGDLQFTFPKKYEDVPVLLERGIKMFLQDPSESIAFLYRNADSVLPLIARLQKDGIYNVRVQNNSNLFLTHFVVRDMKSLLQFALDQTNYELFEQNYYKMGMYLNKESLPHIKAYIAEHPGVKIKDAIKGITFEASSYKRGEQARKPDKGMDAINRVFFDAQYRWKYFDFAAETAPEKAIDIIAEDVGYLDKYLRKKEREDGGASIFSCKNKLKILKMIASLYDTVPEFLAALDNIANFCGVEESNVTLSTIHSSKGLEYDHVVLIDSIGGILPTFESSTKSEEDYNEEIRIFYVAATRARHSLSVLCPQLWYGDSVTPSEFITEYVAEAEKYTVKE